MKNSNIKWIGDIPDNWEVHPLLCYFSERKNKNIKGVENNLLSLSYGKIIRKDINTREGLLPESFNTYNIIEKDDIIIRPTDLQNDKRSLRTAIAKEHGIITSAYIALKSNNEDVNPDFFHYLLHTYDIMKVFYNMGNGVRQGLNYSEFSKLLVCVPPLATQTSIATYLDAKCSEIDGLIADINKQIETLNELKKSTITEAVTKGLNKNAKLKDSGIQWIGMIPEGWSVHPLSCYFSERKKKNTRGLENNLLSLSYGKIVRKDINTREGLLPESFNTYNIIEKDDIIIRPTDLQNDKRSLRTAITKEHGIITSAYIALKTEHKDIKPDFIHYLLHTYDTMKVFYNMGNGVRQGLNFSEFSKLLIVIPPLTEQQSITAYLDTKCTEFDSIISDKQKQISTLEAYKKSLIYEYVTGKYAGADLCVRP